MYISQQPNSGVVYIHKSQDLKVRKATQKWWELILFLGRLQPFSDVQIWIDIEKFTLIKLLKSVIHSYNNKINI